MAKLGLGLNLKLGQGLMMTPQLQQAIKLLTLTHLEMTSVIAKEMVENPMLEETGNEISKDDIRKQKQDDMKNVEATSDNFSGPELVENSKTEFDWDKYVESYNTTSSTPRSAGEYNGNDDQPNYENMVSRGQSLAEHLEWQLRMENLTEEEWELAEEIIHNINDEGYLQESIENIVANCKLHREDAFEILKMIQNLDPVGCGSSSLVECLLAQARALPERMLLVEKMIESQLGNLQKKDYTQIAKEIGVDREKVKEAELVIMGFTPKPGRLVSPEDTQYVVPDIFVHEVAGEFIIKMNNEGVPRLKISNLYKSLIQQSGDTEAQEYVKDKLRAAKWLIDSIENRQKTIMKVSNAIVKAQQLFFKKGPAFLKPMILKDIANEIGMHESTVSRVTTNKFMHTPIGTFELKYFFNAGIGGKNGGIDIASESLKLKIKGLIDNEDPKKPLSDQKIADMLKQGDIVVARRTIAKYREILNISPSSKRKVRE
ncbi:RNA polymerase factor sigma-54 [Bacteriovoracaceae bacterium]|nr:RNA polymerase factor sigma-54 [Bacteriovoracaceae bacterium]